MKEITIRVTDSEYDERFIRELRSLCSQHGIGMHVSQILSEAQKTRIRIKNETKKYFAAKKFWTKVRGAKKINKSDA